KVELRDTQNRKTALPGDLIAEVMYRKPPIVGKTVLGKSLLPADNEQLDVAMGDGIEMRELGKYYATVDGVPMVTDNAVAISQILIHEGDVNLRTGNLRFDGPAEIKGSIDSGATVEITGNLIVHGTIKL